MTTLNSRYDVIVVGGRVAGATLAIRLARGGARVCVVDRDSFPSPTMSTHVLHSVAPLAELGVLDEILAAGAPLLRESRLRIEGVEITMTHPEDPGICPRRDVLDKVLLDAAERSGATVRTGTRVTDVLRRDGVVTGVAVENPDHSREELHATVVVGADGRSSTVARAVGARRYLVTQSARPAFWAYYEGAANPPSAFIWERAGDHLVGGAPTDSGLFLGLAQPSAAVAPSWDATHGKELAVHIGQVNPELGAVLAGATPVGGLRRMPGYQCYFRQSAGPGWVLLGDSGHFKDVTVGQGINDALRQADALAGALLHTLPTPAALPRVLAAWWAWRDADARSMYWFGQDLGAAGPLPDVVVAILASVSGRRSSLEAMHEVMAHRLSPTRVMTPTRLAAATLRSLRGAGGPAVALGQAWALGRTDLKRRLAAGRPRGQAPVPVPTPVPVPLPARDSGSGPVPMPVPSPEPLATSTAKGATHGQREPVRHADHSSSPSS